MQVCSIRPILHNLCTLHAETITKTPGHLICLEVPVQGLEDLACMCVLADVGLQFASTVGCA